MEEKSTTVIEDTKIAIENGDFKTTPHFDDQMEERDIDIYEIEECLDDSWRMPEDDEWREDHGNWTYVFRGQTKNKARLLEFVVAYINKKPTMLGITAIDKDK